MAENNKDLASAFGSSSNPPEPPKPSVKPVAQPVSKKQVEDLLKMLSRPKLALRHTPKGATTRQLRSNADQKIIREVEAIRDRLERRRSAAKEAFKRGHDDKTVRRGRKP